jgi:hypothetical protein
MSGCYDGFSKCSKFLESVSFEFTWHESWLIWREIVVSRRDWDTISMRHTLLFDHDHKKCESQFSHR